MKRVGLGVLVLLLLGGTTIRLSRRWHEERADNRVSLVVDWSEVREFFTRQSLPDEEILHQLRNAGVTAIAVGESSVRDYAAHDFTFRDRRTAEDVLRRLQEHGVRECVIRAEKGRFILYRSGHSWKEIEDIDLGFDREVIQTVARSGLGVVLRVNHDPWLSREAFFAHLRAIRPLQARLFYLMGSDEVPGGIEALPEWQAFLESNQDILLLFEFHPSKSTIKLATRVPSLTYRAHTIPANEMKDLSQAREISRWRRSVDERNCRVLLIHVSPTDSPSTFLASISALRSDVMSRGRELALPKPRMTWALPPPWIRKLGPLVALLGAILSPIAALMLGRTSNPWRSFFQISILTLIGGSMVAVIAENPWTRVEITPFRGVKAAFVLALAGCVLSLYSWEELKKMVAANVRRIDLLVGLAAVCVVGYVVVRMGNASAGWKVGSEQKVRDLLETLLVARPRFKEFAIGYPLLLFGLYFHSLGRESRWLMGIGMIGPISTINTFCHIHSPLYLAFWRSANGILIGMLIGIGLISARKWAAKLL